MITSLFNDIVLVYLDYLLEIIEKNDKVSKDLLIKKLRIKQQSMKYKLKHNYDLTPEQFICLSKLLNKVTYFYLNILSKYEPF